MKISLYQPLLIKELGQRSNQEDHAMPLNPTEHDRLFVLCDGMGGHLKGEVASQMVAEGITRWYNRHFREGMVMTDALFKEALDIAYQLLDAAVDQDFDCGNMGTTLTCLFFHKGGCLAAHVGDSRIYHIRPSESKMLYKSKDHSLVCELYEAGEISFSEMSTSLQRNIITRAMLPGEDNRVEADIVHITDIKPGDYFFLCSDGILEKMADDELIELLSASTTDEQKRDTLIEATAGNRDNHTAVIVHVAGVENEPGDEKLFSDEHTSPYNALLMRKDDDDDEGSITVIDESEQEEPTSLPPPKKEKRNTPKSQGVSKPDNDSKQKKDPTPIIQKQNDSISHEIQKQNDGTSRVSSWLIAMVVAAITAALVVAVYYFV
jgi:protein phosphatase